MLENLIEDFAHSLGSWAYLFVALMATAETAAFLGFIAPGEFTIILGGVLAGEGTLSIQLLIGIVWASIVLGDSIGFILGRKLGRSFASKHGPKVRLTEERLQRVDDYFRRHGGKTIFFGRWVGFVRPLMPFTAGTTGMPYKRFLPYDVLSAGIFATTFCLLGYIFWNNFGTVSSIVGRGAIGFGILVALLIAGHQAFKRLRHPEQREKAAEALRRAGRRPLLRPVALLLTLIWRAVLRPIWRVALVPVWRYVLRPAWHALLPPLRFIGHRLTPGELGVEFTTLIAIAAVATYVFFAYADVVDGGAITPGDAMARDIARDLESGFLTGAAKAVGVLGSWPVVTAGVVACSGFLLAARRHLEAIVLALAFGLSQAALYTTKAIVDRPRPGDSLIDLATPGFPSGHATTSVAWVAIAVIVARRLERQTARVAVVGAAFAVAALVGLSRVYLRAHFLSDVTAGWGLGLAIFSLGGSVALIISYVRNNEPARAEPGEPRPSSSQASESA